MGQATGKLTISHADHKTKQEAAVEQDGDAVQPISAAQIVNGDVTNAPDLPAIDDDIEPVTAKNNIATEVHDDQPVIDASGTEHGPNGSVNATEAHNTSSADTDKSKEEKSAKKTKNPLVWIQRRLSKRMSTSKKGADKATDETNADTEEKKEEAAVALEQAETVAPSVLAAEQQQVVETASSLVDQVLSTAMIQHTSEPTVAQTLQSAPAPIEAVEQQPESTHEPVSEPTEQVDSILADQPPMYPSYSDETAPAAAELVTCTEDSVPVEPEVEHQQPEQEQSPELIPQSDEVEVPMDQVESEPILDTNNTNAEFVEHEQEAEIATTEKMVENEVSADGDHHVNGDSCEHDEEAVAAKLANLELTNGHSEHHATSNGVDASHSDVVVNGD